MSYYTRVLTPFNNGKGLTLEKGDIIHCLEMGRSLVVKTGQEFHPFKDGLSIDTEKLITPDEKGVFLVMEASFGWNLSYDYKPIGSIKTQGSDKFYKLKKGEGLKDYPMWESRDSQLAWLSERKVGYFPPQELKPIKYLAESLILQASTMEEFLKITRLRLEDLSRVKEALVDPGEIYRDQGFSLEMTTEEMYELGRKHYKCFRGYVVERALNVEAHIETQYDSPKLWVKCTRKGKGKSGVSKVQKTFSVKIREYDNGKTEFEVNVK